MSIFSRSAVSLLSVKLLSADFAAVSELSAEKFNGTQFFDLVDGGNLPYNIVEN